MQSYTFSAPPRALDGNKSKFRETVGMAADPRVKKAANLTVDVNKAKTKRFGLATNASPATAEQGAEPVQGRKHLEVQTEQYLEELTERPKELDGETQTEPFLDRPPTPLFIPQKTGTDVETQILPGELFDFDFEVEPMLEVLVGKTLEQALMEVMEEEEMKSLRDHQLEFERRRNAELAEVQRMEAAERRRIEEKERRIKQEKERLEKEAVAKKKTLERETAQAVIADLSRTVFSELKKSHFYDHTQREVETHFFPWLLQNVDANISSIQLAHQIVKGMIKQALVKSAENHQTYIELKKKLEEEPLKKKTKPKGIKFVDADEDNKDHDEKEHKTEEEEENPEE